MVNNVIYGINGPVVTVKNTKDFSMQEMVFVGNDRLIGEVIGINSEYTTIQVYENTTGLKPGEPVYSTSSPMSVTLGPGILSSIFDGIERPLLEIEKNTGAFITRGNTASKLDENKKWNVHITLKAGDEIRPGQVLSLIHILKYRL